MKSNELFAGFNGVNQRNWVKFPHVFIHSGFRCGISRHLRHLPNRAGIFLFSSFDFYFKTSVYHFFFFCCRPFPFVNSLFFFIIVPHFSFIIWAFEYLWFNEALQRFKFKSMVQPVVLFIFFYRNAKNELDWVGDSEFPDAKINILPTQLDCELAVTSCRTKVICKFERG